MANETSKARQMVQSARTALVLDQPFFGVLALHLDVLEDPTCKTAWTDGKTLGYSPTFVQSLSQDELKGLIAHEVMHCACGHCWRRDVREPKKWNVATDYAINAVLTEAGFKLPANGLLDAQFNGQHAEWIYDRIPNQPPDQEPQSGQGSGYGEVRDSPNDSDGTPDPAGQNDSGDANGQEQGQGSGQSPAPSEAEWQQLTKQAATLAQGKLPASMRRLIAEATRPSVDWRSVLRRFVQDTCKSDYTWTRPNRRYLASGLYLPALHAESCGRIVVAVDTSGSVDDVTLAQFASELRSIVAEVRPRETVVVYCDAAVNHTDEYGPDDHLELSSAYGGGGTAFSPVFDQIADTEPPVCVVYLTDLYGSFPDTAPDYPVLWAVYGSNRNDPPFGERVELQ